MRLSKNVGNDFQKNFSITCLIFHMTYITGCVGSAFFELPPQKARDVGVSKKEEFNWLQHATSQKISTFGQLTAALCNGLVDETRMEISDNKNEINEDNLIRIKTYNPNDCIPVPNPKNDKKEKERILVSHFLHISDAQIRDESLYENASDLVSLKAWDPFVEVTLRRPLVEKFDSFTLAAFLAGYGKGLHHEPDNTFVIHTGDLIDISVATELMEAMDTFNAASSELGVKIYSVAGNHDGLVFGNIPDQRADGRGLDLNKSEFVFGHLLESWDETQGFGFGKNEILKSYSGGLNCNEFLEIHKGLNSASANPKNEKTYLNTAKLWVALSEIDNWWEKAGDHCIVAKQVMRRIRNLRDLNQLGKLHDLEWVEGLRIPLTYRKAIDFPGGLDAIGLSIAYYDWCDCDAKWNGKFGINGIRYIVLDTRSSFYAEGTIDWIQLGWLYNKLLEALAKGEAVILFSHHKPDSLPYSIFGDHRPNQVLAKLIQEFPNIMAIFYGHGHKNNTEWPSMDKSYAAFQTGSLADFPQVGREVRIYLSKTESEGYRAEIESKFVRPRGDINLENGFLVDSLLKASRRDSEKEYRTKLLRRVVFPLLPKHKALKTHEWPGDPVLIGKVQPIEIKFDDPKHFGPESFFGKELTNIINYTRQKLKLCPIQIQQNKGKSLKSANKLECPHY